MACVACVACVLDFVFQAKVLCLFDGQATGFFEGNLVMDSFVILQS